MLLNRSVENFKLIYDLNTTTNIVEIETEKGIEVRIARGYSVTKYNKKQGCYHSNYNFKEYGSFEEAFKKLIQASRNNPNSTIALFLHYKESGSSENIFEMVTKDDETHLELKGIDYCGNKKILKFSNALHIDESFKNVDLSEITTFFKKKQVRKTLYNDLYKLNVKKLSFINFKSETKKALYKELIKAYSLFPKYVDVLKIPRIEEIEFRMKQYSGKRKIYPADYNFTKRKIRFLYNYDSDYLHVSTLAHEFAHHIYSFIQDDYTEFDIINEFYQFINTLNFAKKIEKSMEIRKSKFKNIKITKNEEYKSNGTEVFARMFAQYFIVKEGYRTKNNNEYYRELEFSDDEIKEFVKFFNRFVEILYTKYESNKSL